MGWSWPFASTSDNGNSKDTAHGQISSERQKREEQADAELDEFLKSFSTPQAKTVTAPLPAVGGIAPPIRESKQEHETLTDERKVFDDGTVDIRPELLHPRSMNCRQAFDQAFYCQSIGGKFNDIYRYGHLQSCSEQWNAFWFCMRARTLGEGEKARQTVEYYAKRDAKRRKEFGSSEDVWEIRTRSVERAFWKDPDSTTDSRDVKE